MGQRHFPENSYPTSGQLTKARIKAAVPRQEPYKLYRGKGRSLIRLV